MCVTETASKSPVTGRAPILVLSCRDAGTGARVIKDGSAGRAMRTDVL